MELIHIRGSIYDVSPEALHQLLNGYIGDLSFRSRLVGYQMFHDSPDLKVAVETMDDDGVCFVLDARFSGSPEAGIAWGEGLINKLLDADYLYDCSIEVLDENDDPIDEERVLVHPDFEQRYRPR